MTRRAYEAGYKDASADALYDLNLAMRDIENGEPPTTRLERLIADIRAKAMPECE